MDPQNHSTESTRKASIPRYGVIIAVVWCLLIAYSLVWYHLQHREDALLIGKMQGLAYFDKDTLYRRWASSRGGVYVQVSEAAPPNPYLSHVPERDITTPSGRQMTLINPAYMTRQVFEMAQEYKGTGRGHLTSLKLIRPENAPDPWEKQALLAFERGVSEVAQLDHIDGKPYYRYMKPIITEKPCLKCHSFQGYREGDVRGGLSVSVAMEPIYAMMAKGMRGVYINHSIIWLLGLGMIGFGTRKLDRITMQLYEKAVKLERKIKEHQAAQEDLQKQTVMLEEEIAERRQTEVTLRKSEEKFSKTFDNSPLIMTISRVEDGVYLDVNKKFSELSGFSRAEALGKSSIELGLMTPEQQRLSTELQSSGSLSKIELELKSKEGKNITCVLYGESISVDGRNCQLSLANDITERKRAELEILRLNADLEKRVQERTAELELTLATLRDSAALIQAILNTVEDGIITFHALGGIVDTVNPAAERIFGYTASELIGQKFSMLIPELDRDQHNVNGSLEYYSANEEARASGLGREVVGRRKDGSIFPMEMAVSEMLQGGQRYFTGVLRDVTARKQTEEARRTSEELFRIMFVQSPLGIAVINSLTGHIYKANPRFAEISGRSMEEMQNIDWMQITHPDDVQADLDNMALVQTGKTNGFQMEKRYLHPDGTIVWINMTIGSLKAEDEAHPRHLCMVQDITARKQAEEALLKAGALQKAIFDSANFSSIATDAKGVIQIFNVGAERMLGYSAADVMNKITPADISDPEEVIARAEELSLELGTPISPGFEALVFKASRGIEDIYELTYIRKDGSRFPAAVSVTALRDADSNIIGYLLIGTDNTARKQVEAERAQLYRVLQDKNSELEHAMNVAEKANHTKDSFLATMSHEIRTPLTGMLGMLEVLSLTPLNHEQEEMLKATWDSSRSLLRIVSDILDWSKIEDGKLALAPKATSIPQLLQEVVNTYSRVASAKSLTLWQHADIRLSAAHIVDSLRLSQVLNNFVSNAIKFTQRGEIEVSAELLEQLDSGERIRFSVKDSGIGIAKVAQQHLFQRYRQESADTARMYGGTGLGLSICRRLVDLMDGQIELVSEPGQGSIFSFTLILPVSGTSGEPIPILFSEMEQMKVKPLFDDSADAPLVLAVDDHPINRDLLARQIKLLGLRVEPAENGQVALSMWRDGRFALVITDCHMPEMDGYALSRAIRKIETEEARPRTPIIAWTANALAEEEQLCQAAGMDELLVKPADLTQLKKMLAKWLFLSETDSSQTTPSLHDADGGQTTGPIDYVELSKVVPDSAEHIQVLQDFQQHIRADRANLLEMLEQGDQVNAERTAHRMKGSCRMVGATDLATACATIEQSAREGNMDTARAGMTGLDDAIMRFETHCAELTDSTGGNR